MKTKKKKKERKFPGSRHVIRKKAGKSKTGLPYNDVFTETWKAEICVGYQRETNVCCWNIWISLLLRNMVLQSVCLKIGVDTFCVSLGFEVKKPFFHSILWWYWTETVIPGTKSYICAVNAMGYERICPLTGLFAPKSGSVLRWESNGVCKAALVSSHPMIHSAYQTLKD